jgi:integrase
MARSEIEHLRDPERAAWLICGNRVKNGRAHYVPLCGLARDTIRAALELVGDDEQFVFPSPRSEKAIVGHALAVAMGRFADDLEGEAGAKKSWSVEPPTPHDLRRTCHTRLSALGVPKEDRDAVMNHKPTDVGSKHYDLYDRAKEKRQALVIWNDSLVGILAKDRAEVVALKAVGG